MCTKSEKLSELDQYIAFRYNRLKHIRYLLRLNKGKNKPFKTIADMARDLGVKAAWIRSIKHRGIDASPGVCNTGMQG